MHKTAQISLFLFIALAIFCHGIFCSAATTLNVQYIPTANGQTITADSGLVEYFTYLYNAGMVIGFAAIFLSLAFAAVLYVLSPVNAGWMAQAKDRIMGAISGMILLLLVFLITNAIYSGQFTNPEQLKIDDQAKQDKPAAGAYFYGDKGCFKNPSFTTSGISDFGDLNNLINSVKVQKDDQSNAYYIAVVYDNINFYGKCLFLNPQDNCQKVEPFFSSASVYQYNENINGDGVYFYRRAFWNEDGGYLKIDNSDIKQSGFYVANLNDLKFTGNSSNGDCSVPDNEQACTMYNYVGKCVRRECPTLAGEEVNSIKIKGDYAVLLVYFDESKDKDEGPWSYCQMFPKDNDANKEGPKQLKWEYIRTFGKVPNYAVIIPIQR